jgi:hypothetical protein
VDERCPSLAERNRKLLTLAGQQITVAFEERLAHTANLIAATAR